MKVSIIIPVFNTEKFLKRCVDSCLDQTLDGVEIILIDDCSSDNSRNVILEYAKTHTDRIRYIFQKENHRQGAARNRGMEIAKGEYLLFVDSDDWIEPDMCEAMYNKAKELDADMVGANYFLSWDDKYDIKKVNITPDICGTMDTYKKYGYVKHYALFPTRLYKRSFIEENKLKFPENIFYEDAFFNFYSVLYANRIEHIDRPFYHYYQENQSTVRNRNNPRQYERIKLSEKILSFGKQQPELSDYKDIIEYKYLHMQGSNLIYTCMGLFDKPDKDKMREIDRKITEKGLYESKAFQEIPEEFRFFLKLNHYNNSVTVFVFKHGLYSRFKNILTRIKNK